MSNHRPNHAGLFERLIFNNRPVVILLCLLATLFLAWQAGQIRPSTSFEKMIPLEHPYIQNMIEHRDDLANLGNTVRIAVAARQGDIFDAQYVESLGQIHDELFYFNCVVRSALQSLWGPSARCPEVA